MQKIPSLYVRDWDGDRRLVTRQVTPGAQWVIDGEGIATRKYDGTSCLITGSGTGYAFFRRFDAKHGKTPPVDFMPAQDAPDELTGHWPGWIPVGLGPQDKWHREAFDQLYSLSCSSGEQIRYGTYELVGPKLQGNPEGFDAHYLLKHGDTTYPKCPRTFDEIKDFIHYHNIEGLVWHRNDGAPGLEDVPFNMVKIKGTDFGIGRHKK